MERSVMTLPESTGAKMNVAFVEFHFRVAVNCF